MDVLVELFVTAVVALAAAAFAQFGLEFGPAAQGDDGRAVRRSTVAMAAVAPPAKRVVVAPVTEDCPEKARLMDAAARDVQVDVDAINAIDAAVDVALAQADKDIAAALEAAERSRAWAEAERLAEEHKADQAAA